MGKEKKIHIYEKSENYKEISWHNSKSEKQTKKPKQNLKAQQQNKNKNTFNEKN